MTLTTRGFYSRWLERTRPAPAFQEDQPPPERWMHHLWRHQRLLRDGLATSDGEPVRVLHPGFWNRSAGPDFTQALIQFGSTAPVAGDVELDAHASLWTGHRHAGNPRYRNVILHVTWEEESRGSGPRLLGLRRWLEAPLGELVPWILGEAPGLIPANVRGGCTGPLARLQPEAAVALLQDAARHRLLRKASEFQTRARVVGWDRALWEGLMTGLGYRNNTWPLRRIGELTSADADDMPGDLLSAQARMLGLAGFLPDQLGPASPRYVHELWERWWRDRGNYLDVALPRAAWRLGGLRPANHPQRRLALAAHWRLKPVLGSDLARVILTMPSRESPAAVASLLRPPADPYWDHHWTLSGTEGNAGPLLGDARITDLVVNVVLPWLRARSAVGLEPAVSAQVEDRYFDWPAGEDNAVLRLARQRLGLQAGRKWPARAAIQQGLLQVADDFCSTVDSLCSGCPFPALVAEWPANR